MPRFTVEVKFQQERTKEVTVYARDEAEAEEKACDRVMEWNDVIDAEAMNVMEG